MTIDREKKLRHPGCDGVTTVFVTGERFVVQRMGEDGTVRPSVPCVKCGKTIQYTNDL